MTRKSNSPISSLPSLFHLTTHFFVVLDCSTLVTLQLNDNVPSERYRSTKEDKYSPTCVAVGKTGVPSGHGKPEKQFVCFDKFVRMVGRQSPCLGTHNPPTVSVASNTRGNNPTSSIALADARPDGPPPLNQD